MGTVAFNLFPEDEIADFEASCRKYRVSPLEFLIKAEQEPLAVGVALIKRKVLLIHVPTSTNRGYEAGHGSHWNVDFENDLASGMFLKP